MIGDFNFAREPFTNERLPRLLFSATTVLVLAITVVHGFFLTRYLLREREALDIEVEDLRAELEDTNAGIEKARAAVQAARGAATDPRTTFLVGLYRQRSFSWTALFNELETITPGSVRITSIAPSFEDGAISVTLSIVGRTLDNVLEMVRRLEASPFFATVYPLEEANLEDVGRDQTGIAATLTLDYVDPDLESAPGGGDDDDGAPEPEAPSTGLDPESYEYEDEDVPMSAVGSNDSDTDLEIADSELEEDLGLDLDPEMLSDEDEEEQRERVREEPPR